NTKDPGIYEYEISLVDDSLLEKYVGIDINDDLLAQAREHYGENEKMSFHKADFSQGLPFADEKFDIYLTSYGTFSHNHDETTIKLLAEIAQSADSGALIVMDWLGRYSYEWRDLWNESEDKETFMDYRISYIYPPEERTSADIASFKLRLLSRKEAEGLITKASKRSGVEIKMLRLFDRSIFVGRHMETAEYNKHAPALRTIVNSLLEPNCRTDLEGLKIDYVPLEGHDKVNEFFSRFSQCWNALVSHTIDMLASYPDIPQSPEALFAGNTFYPQPLREVIETMHKVICSTGELPGDARANIIEPQLAYSLRKLEMELQQGLGIAHGLCAIAEVVKQ
ncbi:MAG: class I SAM-dependent methyltransferase, partial [Thermodesulfovibrionales bacterium]|nr:class I SAM-dependent methyltransferase [Thermodesulfovibrionales bacterium]